MHIPVKEEKIYDEMSLIPRDPYDPYHTLMQKNTERFYVKEEAFSCSSAEDGEPDIPVPKTHKWQQKSKPVLQNQPVLKD